MNKYSPHVLGVSNLLPDCCSGLRLCRWFGRSQIVRHKSVTFFLDGAHTPESMKVLFLLEA